MLFNWIDVIAFLLLCLAIYAGFRIGFFSLLFVVAGFFGTFLVGIMVVPRLLHDSNNGVLLVIGLNVLILASLYIGFRAFDIGQRLKRGLHHHLTGWLESTLGVAIGLVSMLLIIWLLGAMFGRLPFVGLSNTVNDSFIVQQLDTRMPPVPSVFAAYSHLIDPNTPPKVYVKNPSDPVPLPTSYDQFQAILAVSSASTVRVTSFGCGGLVSGSGFVAGPGLVATNAHIIAGVKRPIVKLGQQSYEGVPVFFNASLDLALLRVEGLSAPPLPIYSKTVSVNTSVVVLGYPGGDYQVMPGIITGGVRITGPTIYGLGSVDRAAYGVQVNDDEGGSGGPVLLMNGEVAGIMFAKATDIDNYGYSLKTLPLTEALAQVGTSTRRVSTGVCIAD